MYTKELPYLTGAIPGVGGVIKRFDEDFVVEEIPRYAASGAGTHLYFTMEKRGLTTLAAIRRIAGALGRKPQDIGYAGMKDTHGLTRQVLSVEHIEAQSIQSLNLSRIRLKLVGRHTNKIKLGHLSGNRFVIKIRDAIADALGSAQRVIELLSKNGLPNYFGPQRFGSRGDNALVGRAILNDDYDEALAIMLGRPGERDTADVQEARRLFDTGDLNAAADAWPPGFGDSARLCRSLYNAQGDSRRAWRSVHHTMRKFYFSATQSELFNEVLALRIDRLDQLETGDVAWKHQNGACFLVEDAAAEQARCDDFEISATGPLFGKGMKEPVGIPGKVEADVLALSGIAKERWRSKDGSKLTGARRPLRVPLKDTVVDSGKDDQGPFVRLAFVLPPGAYATCVTRELCKADA